MQLDRRFVTLPAAKGADDIVEQAGIRCVQLGRHAAITPLQSDRRTRFVWVGGVPPAPGAAALTVTIGRWCAAG